MLSERIVKHANRVYCMPLILHTYVQYICTHMHLGVLSMMVHVSGKRELLPLETSQAAVTFGFSIGQHWKVTLYCRHVS